jgi:putative heme-binding domain-containing protein
MIALLFLAALLPAPAGRQDRHDPEAERRSFTAAEGFEVTLFASEKDGVVKPIQMRWDERGRLWVTCSPSYPQVAPGDRPDDFIVVVEDADRDGRADGSTVFARGLAMPMGLELGRGGAFVGDGHELVHLSDTDGDGRADTRKVLLRGFFTADSHQNINNFIWGPGGELLFCQGLHAFSQVETPWGIESLQKAGVWRLRDRRLRLDAFLGEDMGPQNPWGVAFDDWGQPLLVAGNGQGIYYLVPAMQRTNHFLRFPQIWDRQGPKFAGPDILGSRHLPDEVQGLLVAGSFMNNTVSWFRLTEDGAGFRAREVPPLLVSKSVAFRPVDVKAGPDGAIYVADWYNPIIGHYQASLRHPDRDKTRGRIWRIAARGRPPAAAPALSRLSAAELLDQLRSPERWVRYQAKRLLADRPRDAVARALAGWTEGERDERVLVEALGVYESQEIVEPRLLRRLLHAADPRARAYAAGVIGHWHDRLKDPLAWLEKPVADEHPRVRLAAVVAASYVTEEPRAIELAARVLDRPTDKFLGYALTQTVHALKPSWKPGFEQGKLTFDNRPERLEFVLKADGSKDVLGPVLKLLESPGLNAESRENLLALLARVGGPKELSLVLDAAPSGRVLQELAAAHRLRKVVPEGDLEGRLNGLLAKEPGGALTLAGLWKVEALRAAAERAARDPAAPLGVRRAALEALADYGARDRLQELAAAPGAARAAAVAALARLDVAAAAGAAAALFAEPGEDPGPVTDAFLSRQGGAEALGAALARAKVSADAAKLALRAMSTAGRPDPVLRDVLVKAAGLGAPVPEHSAEFVRALAREAAAGGDPARGEKVFRGALTNCVTCHAIGGGGGRAGPDLATLGTAMPADLIIESVLWPNRQVKEGYGSTLVVTENDRIVQGYALNEDRQQLVLRDPHTDETVAIPKGDIRARKEAGSIMPEGLAHGLTRGELRDLVRFLTELGKPGPFRVPERPIVRRWKVGVRPSETPPDAWALKYSTVSGELPLEDAAPSGWLRFEVDVLRRGSFRPGVSRPEGLSLWVDGRPAAFGNDLDLETGRRTFTVKVDAARRDGAGLLCTLEPSPGSAGEARLNIPDAR